MKEEDVAAVVATVKRCREAWLDCTARSADLEAAVVSARSELKSCGKGAERWLSGGLARVAARRHGGGAAHRGQRRCVVVSRREKPPE